MQKVSKNFKGVAKARKKSTIGLQILIELLTTANINIANIETAEAIRIKISKTARISKGNKQ